MRPAILRIVIIGSIVAVSVILTAAASTFALARAQVQLLDGDMASVIRADYSADPEGTSLAPFEEGITDAVRRDEARLREEVPAVEIVPVSYADPPEESTPSASPTQTPTATPPASGETPPPGTTPPPPAATLPPAPAPTPTPIPIPTPTVALFGPVADSYVDQKRPKQNFGTQTTMEVRTWAPEKNERAFVRFDVSSIPAGSTVSLATLTLCATAVPSVTRTYNLHQVTAVWDEAKLTWNTQANSGTVTVSATTPASPGCMSWTVTADVQAWVGGPIYKGWEVRDAVEDSATKYSTVFRTRENSVAAERPTLNVTYTTP